MDLYRFQATCDSAVHFVAFFGARGEGKGKGVACLGFGWIWDGLDDGYFKDMEHFVLARRAGFVFAPGYLNFLFPFSS